MTKFRNLNGALVVSGEILKDSEDNPVPFVGFQWMRVMIDMEQCFLRLPLLSIPSLTGQVCFAVSQPISLCLCNHLSPYLEPFCCFRSVLHLFASPSLPWH